MVDLTATVIELEEMNGHLEAENALQKTVIETLRSRDAVLTQMLKILETQNADLESRIREFTLYYDEKAGA